MIRVRPATPADAPALADIDARVTAAGHGVVRLPAPPSVAKTGERITRFTEGNRSGDAGAMLVAERAGRLVGEASVHRLEPELCGHVAVLALHVDPAAQGQGAGKALLDAVVAWAERAGIVRLELYVRGDNPRAIGLYRSRGFHFEGSRTAFVRAPGGAWVNDLVMARFFAPPAAHKAVAFLVRTDRGAPELLCFHHPEGGGVQVPKGTVDPGETPEQAVVRELAEETGVTAATVARALPSWDPPFPGAEPGELVLHRWHPFVLAPTAPLPDRWAHVAHGSPEEDGLVFTCFWLRLDAPPPFELHRRFAEAIARARAAVQGRS